MNELIDVLSELVREAEAGRDAALCLVVRTRGSTPQCAGAALLLRRDFSTLGTLGGGCVEAEVRRRAFDLLERRQSAQLEFVLDHDYGWDDGLICGGKMTVAVVPVSPSSDLAAVRAALEAHQQGRAAHVPIRVMHEGAALEYALRIEPSPTLLIAGAGHVGLALARLAVELDFDVAVVDDRADMASPRRFGPRVRLIVADIAAALRDYPLDERCYVVIVTRGHSRDQQALEAVVRRPAAYVGLIGSRRKSTLILRELAAAGVAAERLAVVRTPIGLPIGAVTVNEIAVSIAAELVQVRRSRGGGTCVAGPPSRAAVAATGGAP